MFKSPIVSRLISTALIDGLKHFPFISVTGPRQSGKTTICHLIGQGYTYINFEIAKFRNFAIEDPEGFLEKYPSKIILDEVQKVPALFPYLMVHSDTLNANGSFILSGSQNLLLMQQITQSLAGRVAIFSLLPLSYQELKPYLLKNQNNWEYLAFRGFFPRLFVEKTLAPNIFYSSYIKTYLNKDISQLANIHNARLFKKFIYLLAARAGTVLNHASLANDLNIDAKTVQRWISYLETSYIVYLLPSYHNNFSKRITKAEKIYFTDTGLLCYLLGIKSQQSLADNNFYGQIFENFVIMEKMKASYNKGEDPNFYYWQDSNKREVDLIIENTKLEIFEIKSTTTPKIEFAKNLMAFSELATLHGHQVVATVLYNGHDNYTQNKIHFLPWTEGL